MSCNPLAVNLESCVSVPHTTEVCPTTVITPENGPLTTGVALDNPCCIIGALQILYGMPFLQGEQFTYGSTV